MEKINDIDSKKEILTTMLFAISENINNINKEQKNETKLLKKLIKELNEKLEGCRNEILKQKFIEYVIKNLVNQKESYKDMPCKENLRNYFKYLFKDYIIKNEQNKKLEEFNVSKEKVNELIKNIFIY